jgi:phosphoserine phosphatase
MLVAFDFDGTLSDSEMTVLLGERCGVADEMGAITERAMNDEIDYATSLRERAALLEGLSEAEAAAAFDAVELREGSAALVDDLRAAGHTVAVLTGGFERGVEAALARAGTTVDLVVANRLPIADGALTRGRRTTSSPGCRPTSASRWQTRSPSATARTTARCSKSRASPWDSRPSRPWRRPATRP